MPIDTSMYNNSKPVELTNPLTAFLQYQQAQQAQNVNALAPLQQQEMQLKLLQAQRMGEANKYWYDMLQGGGSPNSLAAPSGSPNALAAATDAPDGVPAGGNALAATPQAQQGGFPLSMRQVIAANGLGMTGAKEIAELYKYNNDGVKIDPNSFRKDPATGKLTYYADPTKGMNYDPNTGEVTPIKGAATTLAGITRANKAAEVSATNAGTPANPAAMMTGPDGTPIVVPGVTLADQMAYRAGKSQPTQQPMQQPGQPPAQQPAAQGQQGPQGLNLSQLDPKMMAYLAKTNPQAFAKGTQNFQQTANDPGGYTAPTTTASGEQLPPQATQALTTIGNSRDPARLNQFSQMMRLQIAKMAPEKQPSAMADLQNEISGIQQFWQQSQAQPTKAGSGGTGLMTPAQIEADKTRQVEQAKSGVELNMKPQIDFRAKYEPELNNQVDDAQKIQRQMSILSQLADKIKTGGSSTSRAELAKLSEGLPFSSPALTNFIAGGNLADSQLFDKIASTETMSLMQQANQQDNGAGGKTNRTMLQYFIDHNINRDSNKGAINGMRELSDQLTRQTLEKSNMYYKNKGNPGYDVTNFPNEWANYQQKQGYLNPTVPNTSPQTNQAAKPAAKPSALPVVNAQGWRLHTDPKGVHAYVSPDGKQFIEAK